MRICASKVPPPTLFFFLFFFAFFGRMGGTLFISGINVPMKIVPLPAWMMPLDTGYVRGKPGPNHISSIAGPWDELLFQGGRMEPKTLESSISNRFQLIGQLDTHQPQHFWLLI